MSNQSKNIVRDPVRVIEACRVCGSMRLEEAIDFGNHPWCGHFLKKEELGTEPLYPLRVIFCLDCKTPQLDYTVPKEIMFGDHTYLSNITSTLSNHFRSLAEELDDRFFKNKSDKTILDIGSNDGMQLSHYKELGFNVLGVEPAKTVAAIANASGIETLNKFFNLSVARDINRKFDLINASGVLFHLEELHSVIDGIGESLASEGVFLVQFLYMKRILENMAFDQIYHEHLLYYNLENLSKLLEMHDLEIFDAYLSPIHGGSMIAFIDHKGRRPKSARLIRALEKERQDKSNELETYISFGEAIKKMKERNVSYIRNAKEKGKRIFGFGAPAKGNTMLHYFGITNKDIDYLVEKNELRRGLYSPVSHIPIVIEKEFHEIPDVYYCLAWNFKKEILKNNKHLIDKGVHFYFPVDPQDIEVA